MITAGDYPAGVSLPEPSPADFDAAAATVSHHGHAEAAQSGGVPELAAALGVLRRIDGGEDIPAAVVLAAHDLLYASAARYRDGGCMRRLAEVLVGRGAVPGPRDYEGQWWLWWPKSGRGPCRDCHQTRALTRYSARFGKDYRYLCERCRAAERDQDAQGADRLLALLSGSSQPVARTDHDQSSMSGVVAQGAPAHGTAAKRPTDREWDGYVERLHELLAPLERAGFELPEEWDSDFDPATGAVLFSEVWRGDGCVQVEYRPHEAVLALVPFEDMDGEQPESYSLLDDTVETAVEAFGQEAVIAVARAAGRAGLLDATHVRAADTVTEEAKRGFAFHRMRRIFEPAAAFRQLPLSEIMREVSEDEWLCAYLDWVVGTSGQDVAPDVVPDAAALGVAAWCWRNNTAVEDHHLPTDVLMARVNIAVTRIAQEHVCPDDGIDWDAIHTALMDPQWALPDGTRVHQLFGPGWREVASTVTAELIRWRRLDHDVLGPTTTLILMTIGGSGDYTDSWWGQGRWHSICQQIVEDATAAVPLPEPYDARGCAELLADLENPDLLPDQVLDWLIDLPGSDIDGPRGLRFNQATRPPLRRWDPF